MKQKTGSIPTPEFNLPDFDPPDDESDKHFIPTPHEFCLLFISALVNFVHPDCPFSINRFPHLTPLQMTYWRLNFHKIIKLVAKTLESACKSEWWQMVFAAKINLGHGLLMHFNEDKFPLEKPGSERPVQILTIEVPDYGHAPSVYEALAKQGKRPAGVRETLQFLQSNWQSLKSATCLLSPVDSNREVGYVTFSRQHKRVQSRQERWRYRTTDRLNKHLTANSVESFRNSSNYPQNYRFFVVNL